MASPVALSLRELERVEQLLVAACSAERRAVAAGDGEGAAFALGVVDTLAWLTGGRPSEHLITLTLEQ